MVMLINTTNEYLYEKKRDLLILRLKTPDNGKFNLFGFDRDDEETNRLAREQLNWFSSHDINSYMTCSPGMLAGWDGLYYIDIDPRSDLVIEYSKKFEDADGKSLTPHYNQMLLLSYDEWVANNGIEEHEQHLRELEDSDYNP